MEPTKRIAAIIEIGRRLGTEKWTLIDLTLRQFGQQTYDAWQGTREDYVMSVLENANDDVLRAIGAHVELDIDGGRSVVGPKFWRDGYLRLFISHLAAHRKFASDLQTALQRYAISSFVAHNDIEPTREWIDEIEAAMASCDAALALMHPEFHYSPWVDQELGFVMGRGVPMLTARLGQDPYGFLGRFQALKCVREDYNVLADEIFGVLVTHKSTKARMSGALVTRLESSEDFAAAKANVGVLERVTYWDAALTARCRQAVATNNQVGDSFVAPGKIEAVIKRFEDFG